MMPLDQLPNEILYLIFTSFGRDGSPTLYKLSLTNRTISEIARPLIHSTIHLHPLQPGGESEAARFAASYPHCCSAGAKQSLLRRTIDENPGFGHGVDVLNICFKTKHEIHRRPMFQGQAWKHFLALLKQFPKVRHLDMNCGRMNQVALLLDKDLGMRGSLEEINLLARGITPLQLFDLTCLPNLRRLIVRGSLFGRWSEDYVKPPQQNNLQSLVMAFGIKLATLREILKCSMKLKTLFFCAPLDSIRQPDLIIHGFVPQECRKRLEPFFAAAMGEVLELVNGTLERLCVQSTRAIWSASDGTRLDLSSFRALRVVSLTAWCLFEPLSTERRRRGGIFKLLPRSLENFYLRFQANIGIFYEVIDNKIDEKERRDFTNNSMEEHKVLWISQLADEKEKYFPRLKAVELREEIETETKELFHIDKWELPDDLKSVFEKEGIELSVEVRAPTVVSPLEAAHRALAHIHI